MKVSYIVPCFNRTIQLRETLLSILCQNDHNSEIIVVDDASTVDTYTAIADLTILGSIKYIKLDTNLGVCGAKNVGVKSASGDILVFVDSDDLLSEGASEKIRRRVEEVPDRALFFACVDERGKSSYRVDSRFGTYSYNELLKNEAPGEFLPVVPRHLAISIPFETRLRGFEHITWLKCAQHSGSVVFFRDVVRIYRLGGADRMCAPKNLFAGAPRLASGWYSYLETFEQDLVRNARRRFITSTIKAIIYARVAGFTHEPKIIDSRARGLAKIVRAMIYCVPKTFAKRVLQSWIGA